MFDYTGFLKGLGQRSNPTYDVYDPLHPGAPASSTYGALSRVIEPISTRRLRSLGTGGRSFGTTGEEPEIVLPGPLSTWQLESKARPYQQVGKLGVNLLGTGSAIAPGRQTAYGLPPGMEAGGEYEAPEPAEQLRAMADPDNPQNRGFWEGLFGAVGGLFGTGGQGVGSFVGSVVDAPLEAAGNVIGLPGALATSGFFGGQQRWDDDIQAIYDKAADQNPFNGLLLWSQAAKAQWTRDEAAGRHTGLYQDFGPATALTDQMGWVMQAIFSGTRLLQRPGQEQRSYESLLKVEQAIRSGAEVQYDEEGKISSTSPDVQSAAWARIQERYARGDFGPLGSQEARDKAVDQLIVEGSTLRAAGDAEQDGWITGQGLADIGLSLMTDPTILLSGGFGAIGKLGKIGTMTASAKFWKAVPADILPEVMTRFEKAGVALGMEHPDQVWARLSRATRPQIVQQYDATGQLPGLTDRSIARTTADRQWERQVIDTVLKDYAGQPWAKDAESAYAYIERWRSTWEPALRPINAIVQTVNDPLRLFGSGRAERLASDVYSHQATEGILRGQGSLDAHTVVQKDLEAVGGDLRMKYDRGIGVAASFESRVYHRRGLLSDMRRRIAGGDLTVGDMMKHLPDEVISARMAGSEARDIASGLEKQMLRFRPLYTAAEGGVEAGRADISRKLQIMGATKTDADRVVSGWGRNELAEMDLSYFGWAQDTFVDALEAARSSGFTSKNIDIDTLTMLSHRTLTAQEAEGVLAMIARGETDEVRRAMARYDVLYENVDDGLDGAELLAAVKEVIETQADALPTALTDEAYGELPPRLADWAERNGTEGFRLGFRPSETEKLWKVTTDPDTGQVISIGAWLDPIGHASQVPTYNLAKRVADTLFHNIRGERIMADARIRLAYFTSDKWGISRSTSDALFARFLRNAQESGITPRGMRPESIIKIVKTHDIPPEIKERIGVREATEALLFAFEGDWRRVGLSQKFTGYTKTALGGQSNWLGLVAERIYPMVRFTLNPLFQAQEMIEPFVLNLMRGIKPGFRLKWIDQIDPATGAKVIDPDTGEVVKVLAPNSEMDERTLSLVQIILSDGGIRPLDDQVERDVTLLWGADSARNAFGPSTRLGKITRRLALNDALNVKEIKRINFARAIRRELGKEFQYSIRNIAPDLYSKLPAIYKTGDWGEIAVRFLTDKSYLPNGKFTPTGVLKPSNLGHRRPVDLEEMLGVMKAEGADAAMFDEIADVDTLRARVQAKAIDPTDFKDTLMRAGADEDYATRAWTTVSSPITADEFWEAYRVLYRNGNAKATAADRAINSALAASAGMTEEEYIARTFADVVMSADERDLLSLAVDDQQWVRFMGGVSDEAIGRTAATDATVSAFREKFAHVADREHLIIADDAGQIVAEVQQPHAWKVHPTGAVTEAGIGEEVMAHFAKVAGRTVVHNHPTHIPFSPADLTFGIMGGAKENIVTSPGITYSIRPHVSHGWFTPEFVAKYGDMPVGDAAAIDRHHLALQEKIGEEWEAGYAELYQRLKRSNFYDNRDSEFWSEMAHAVAISTTLDNMARKYGWEFSTVTDFRLPTDYARKHALLTQMAANPPKHLVQANPYAFRAAPLVRHDLRNGTSVAFEYASAHRKWMPEEIPDEAKRAIMDGWEQWYRARVLPMLGAIVTDVRRGGGGWLDTTGIPNITFDVYGPPDMVELVAATTGYLLKQDAVVTSRAKAAVGQSVADATKGERWAVDFIATRELSTEEAAELATRIQATAPDIHGWGYHEALTADGRTAIRFVNWAQEGAVEKQAFLQQISGEWGKIGGTDFGQDLTVMPVAVDYRYVDNDWEGAASAGQNYLAGIGARRSDVVRQLEYGLAEESEGVLASLAKQHAPAEFDAHVAALRDAGEFVPDFRVPGDWADTPLADRVSISIPGGREGLLNEPDRVLTLWEQQLIKAQTINASAAYDADPDLYTALMRSVWASKEKPLDDATGIYNTFAFGAVTANAALDTSEGAFAMIRANRDPYRTLERMIVRAERLANDLPEAYRDDANAINIIMQRDEGLRASGLEPGRADWLDEDEITRVTGIINRLDERLNAVSDAERPALVKEIQTELEAQSIGVEGGKIRLEAHPFPVQVEDWNATTQIASYMSVVRPGVRYKGTTTGEAWGNILQWLRRGVFNSDNAEVQQFIRPKPGESRTSYAMRMSSILRGINVKTALMAMQAAGPGQIGHGALDVHILRFIAQSAQKRGDLDNLLAQLTDTTANNMRLGLAQMTDGLKGGFKSPKGKQTRLVPTNLQKAAWGPEKEQAMRARLHLIEDPELRAQYEGSEILRMVSEASPEGYVNEWGGDYAVLEEYFQTVLRMDEVDRLRAAGHTAAADRVAAMSGGEWQWFKWDHIRSASAGTPLDPHVGITRGADAMSIRSGVEMDRALMVNRLNSPYDPVNSIALQQHDGKVLGAHALLEDGRAILLATQHADGRTGLHELAHAFRRYMDPSMEGQIVAEYRRATGSRVTRWNRKVEEWWADSILDFARSGGQQNPELRSSFMYLQRNLNTIESNLLRAQQRTVVQETRAKIMAKAEAAIREQKPAVAKAEVATRQAQRTYERAARELRRARARASVPVLEDRAATLRATAEHLDQNLRDAKSAVRAARSAAREADVRAKGALGTPSAGGMRADANRKAAAISGAEARVKQIEGDLAKARNAATKANRAVAAAKRRVPLGDLTKARDKAQDAVQKALRSQRDASGALKKAQDELDRATQMPTNVRRPAAPKVEMSPEMREIWDKITTPLKDKSIIHGTGEPYDIQQEAVYQAARNALSRAEENAFTLHYYKRGRSLVERSINHPYFGLYPASYMWGKILPEMTRFLLKSPFGIDAPLLGLESANNIYRSVMIQQQYDPDFRREMAENSDFFHLLALLTPSLPWEVPVNAPLWLRRLSEGGLEYKDRMAEYNEELQAGTLTPRELENPPTLNDIQDVGRIGSEMLQYAFGPANAITELTDALHTGGDIVTTPTAAAVQAVQGLLDGGDAVVDGATTLPAARPVTGPF